MNRPSRNTVPIPTRIAPEILERAKVDAQRRGYRSLRAYLEALIAGDDDESCSTGEETQALAAAYPSSAWALGPTILLHRTVVALEAVVQRVRAGEDVGTLERDLCALRREIGEHLFALRADYDHEVEARDQRHYGRVGGVE